MRHADAQFLTLLHQEEAKLLRLARALTGQDADAWDLVQEATLSAYDHFAALRGGPESFGPWIRRILVNRARDLLRARSRMVPFEAVAEAEVDSEPGPEERFSQSLLWAEVMALDDHYRQVLTLRFLVDMKVEEIARVLDVPVGTVKSRVHRAVNALKKRLDTGVEGVVEHT